MLRVAAVLLLGAQASGLVVLQGRTSRRQTLQAAGAALALPLAPLAVVAEEALEVPPAPPAPPSPPPPVKSDAPAATKSGVGITVLKAGGGGGKPVVGDLIAVRFKGSVTKTGAVFDDIMESVEPYYFRVGSEKVLPGVEDAVKLMRTGDVWELAVPGKLGFGEKGRSASPGKPRIPSNADLTFVVELVAVPGKDEEILDVTGGEQ